MRDLRRRRADLVDQIEHGLLAHFEQPRLRPVQVPRLYERVYARTDDSGPRPPPSLKQFAILLAAGACQIERQQPRQDFLIGQIRGPAVGGADRGVEFAMRVDPATWAARCRGW